MPFDVLTTITKTTARMSASISYRRNDTKHGKSKLPKLVIAIPKAMMGTNPISKSAKFALLIGTGADKGRGRIVPIVPTEEGINPTVFVGGLVFRFGHVPMLGDNAAAKEDMALRLLEPGWEFDLPAWFKSDEPERKAEPGVESDPLASNPPTLKSIRRSARG